MYCGDRSKHCGISAVALHFCLLILSHVAVSNKYNTYANKGLPKGPIGSPQLASIKAAAAPEKNPYYYWVTVDLDSGETKYSRTYAEHQRYVEEYNQWCTKHPNRCS